jgi:tRNA(Ile2) C34 agmatinyltransferase TiaS
MMADDVKPWDLLNPNSPRSPEELAVYRLKICRGCEFFRPKTQTCKKCGCFMKAKSMLLNAKCPVGKW